MKQDFDVCCCMKVKACDSAVPGSTKEICSECGDEVWLSPATKQSIGQSQTPVKLMCVECVLIAVEKEKSKLPPQFNSDTASSC